MYDVVFWVFFEFEGNKDRDVWLFIIIIKKIGILRFKLLFIDIYNKI